MYRAAKGSVTSIRPSPLGRYVPLWPLLLRAAGLYASLRLLVAAVSVAVAIQGGPSLDFDYPPGFVILTIVLGVIDIGRRGERILWLNLGFSRMTTAAVFGVVAVLGEVFTAFVRD